MATTINVMVTVDLDVPAEVLARWLREELNIWRAEAPRDNGLDDDEHALALDDYDGEIRVEGAQ